MTPDQITALLTAFGAVVLAVIPFALRWTSRAGRTLRRQRDDNEDQLEVIHETRRMAIAAQVPRTSLPLTRAEKRERALRALGGAGDDETED